MKNRPFIAAVIVVSALAALILLQNVRETTASFFGPPNVDEEAVLSKVKSGDLSFKEARFYSLESDPPGPPEDQKTEIPAEDADQRKEDRR